MALNPATISYVDMLVQDRESHYQEIRTFRDYAAGDQAAQLTDDQKILLVGDDGAGHPNSAPEFAINVCSTILDVETDRLELRGFQISAGDNDALGDTLTDLVWKRWKASRMDEGQQNVHYAACRDKNSFIMPYFDNERGEARLAFNKAYDGETSGIDMFYEDDDPNKPLFAVKVWEVGRPTVGNLNTNRIRRKNVYYADRIEKYINTESSGTFANAAWRPLRPGDPDWEDTLQTVALVDDLGNEYQATVDWWVSPRTGLPLGLPVVAFRHQSRGEADGRSAIADVAPGLQDAINMAGVSVLAATMLSGFKVTWATGFRPEGNTTLAVYPGAILYNDEDGSFGQLQETNLMQLIEVLNNFIKNAATLTSTPLTFFNMTGQVPAEGTQKQLELGLLAKTRRNQTSYGNSYEDVIRLLLRLESEFGTEIALTPEQIDDLDISAEWEPAEVRNEREVNELAIMRHEKLSTPLEVAWSEVGYTQDEIDQMSEAADIKRNQVMGQLAQTIVQAEQEAAQQAAQEGDNAQAVNAPNFVATATGAGNGANAA